MYLTSALSLRQHLVPRISTSHRCDPTLEFPRKLHALRRLTPNMTKAFDFDVSGFDQSDLVANCDGTSPLCELLRIGLTRRLFLPPKEMFNSESVYHSFLIPTTWVTVNYRRIYLSHNLLRHLVPCNLSANIAPDVPLTVHGKTFVGMYCRPNDRDPDPATSLELLTPRPAGRHIPEGEKNKKMRAFFMPLYLPGHVPIG